MYKLAIIAVLLSLFFFLSFSSRTIYMCNSCKEPQHLYINSITLITDTLSRCTSSPPFPFLFVLLSFVSNLCHLLLCSVQLINYRPKSHDTTILTTAYPRFVICSITTASCLHRNTIFS